MDVVPQPRPAEAGIERSVLEVMDHLVALLDETCQDFEGVQRVVGENMAAAPLSDQDVQVLQKLDSATQTVEAVSTILKNLITSGGPCVGQSLDVAALSRGVKLSHVVQVLQNGIEAEPECHSGEVDLF
ncbi:hypothetical protein HK27_13630 [Acetobacter orientalis]|uniref:Uncharacterized protein n=2 Tax=Acetobacter TaxID=434 RepID=A0A252C007_9PROT|nr:MULTISPECIES: hypothetical protein [Acetobacter]KXV74773.1 hypothetical protein AD953_10280 [Acetobacter malorum]OUJ14529.1 hypothetical protein HK27_13630 [Acetobacter orientalis]BBC81834.1 hypothetical protein AcetOrient_orf00203p [Acetobacter orientalis]